MKSRTTEDKTNGSGDAINGSKSIEKHKQRMMKKKNMRRLGGGGLSLEAFANAKSMTNNYNPALIKKKKEFYKNAKYVSKYKKSLRRQGEQNDISSAAKPLQLQDKNEVEGVSQSKKNKNKKRDGSHSLQELYEKKREEEERARIEREAIFQAKREDKERAESQRKAAREKMFKKTRKGQPIMKYRIEHLLQTIQGPTT